MKTSIDKEFLSLSGGEIAGDLSVDGSINGNLSGNSDTATKLATARTIRTNLASTSTASFDGTNNISPGVTGVLPVANGGTGSSTEKYLPLTGGTLTGNLTVSGKNVVRSVNGTNADSSGNVSITINSYPTVFIANQSTTINLPNYGTWKVLYMNWGTDWGAPQTTSLAGGSAIPMAYSRTVVFAVRTS